MPGGSELGVREEKVLRLNDPDGRTPPEDERPVKKIIGSIFAKNVTKSAGERKDLVIALARFGRERSKGGFTDREREISLPVVSRLGS